MDRLILDPAISGGTESDTDFTGGRATETLDPSSPTSPTSPTDPTTPTTTLPPDPTNPTEPPVPTEGPPQLLDVRVQSAQTLELFFSEPMGDPGGVDPGLFRLSLAYSNYYADYYDYGGTFYTDLKQFTGTETCDEYCYCNYYDYDYDECEKGGEYYYCNEYCYQEPGPPIEAVSLVPGAYADRLIVNLDTPITAQVCAKVREFQEGWSGAGLFLHYSNNGIPVQDSQGEDLLPIAEHWVLPPRRDYGYTQGYFPSMTPFIQIVCPF